MRNCRKILFAILFACLVTTHAPVHEQYVEGSKNHPMIKRYPESRVAG